MVRRRTTLENSKPRTRCFYTSASTSRRNRLCTLNFTGAFLPRRKNVTFLFRHPQPPPSVDASSSHLCTKSRGGKIHVPSLRPRGNEVYEERPSSIQVSRVIELGTFLVAEIKWRRATESFNPLDRDGLLEEEAAGEELRVTFVKGDFCGEDS